MRSILRKLVLWVLLACLFFPLSAAQAQGNKLHVFFSGPDGGVRTALSLDKNILFVTDPTQADVFVLNGTLAAMDVDTLRIKLEAGRGLVLILGPGLTSQDISGLLGEPLTLEKKDDALSLAPVADSQDSLVKSVLWTSAPQVRERFTLTGGDLTPLVSGFEDSSLVMGTSFHINSFPRQGNQPRATAVAVFQLHGLPPGRARRRADTVILC
jgi:hypothetical protein